MGYHDINLHVSLLLRVQEVGSRATRPLAPVSLGMPACSPGGDRGDRSGASRGVSHPLSLPLFLSHPLCLSQENHNRVLYSGAKRGGFRWQPSMICRRTEGSGIAPSVPHTDTVQCNTPHISNNEAPCSHSVHTRRFCCLHRPVTGKIQCLLSPCQMFK